MRQIKIHSISERIEIVGEDALHLIYSLRSKAGEKLTVIDETGKRALIELVDFSKDKVIGRLIKELPSMKTETTQLAVAIPKRGFDDIVRQATEIGVDSIQPLMTERTVANPSSAKEERWRRIAKESAQQSSALEPTIFPIMSFEDWLRKNCSNQIIACSASENQTFIADIDLSETSAILIGSEGGFSGNELKLLEESANVISVSLGENILRVDTAAIFALAVVKSRLYKSSSSQ